MKVRKIAVDREVVLGGGDLVFIAGPCVIESRKMALDLARRLSALAAKLKEQGYPVARRTVAKYRGMLEIPSTSERRRR